MIGGEGMHSCFSNIAVILNTVENIFEIKDWLRTSKESDLFDVWVFMHIVDHYHSSIDDCLHTRWIV